MHKNLCDTKIYIFIYIAIVFWKNLSAYDVEELVGDGLLAHLVEL